MNIYYTHGVRTAPGHGLHAVYRKEEADTELARLKAEIEGLVNDHNVKDINIAYMREQIELYKATLRWCLESGAVTSLRNGVLRGTPMSAAHTLDIPPEYAPLIAEAVKQEENKHGS